MFFYRLLSIDVLWFQILESRVQLTNGSFLHLECWCISSFSIQRDLIMQNRVLRKKMYWFAGVWVLKCLYDFNHSFVFTVLLKPWSQLNGSFKTPFMVEAKTGQTALSQAAKSWKRFTDTKARCTFREIFTSFMSQIIDPLVVSAGSSHTVSLRIHRSLLQGRKDQVLAALSVLENFLRVVLIKFVWTEDSFLSHSYAL